MTRKRRNYSEAFKKEVLSAYESSDETVLEIARRFEVSLDTVKNWVYRRRPPALTDCAKNVKFAQSETILMKKKEKLSAEAMEVRISELERELATERMRSESLSKMIEIAERELKIDIRKKSGAKQPSR